MTKERGERREEREGVGSLPVTWTGNNIVNI
jgi:hypothetical protein